MELYLSSENLEILNDILTNSYNESSDSINLIESVEFATNDHYFPVIMNSFPYDESIHCQVLNNNIKVFYNIVDINSLININFDDVFNDLNNKNLPTINYDDLSNKNSIKTEKTKNVISKNNISLKINRVKQQKEPNLIKKTNKKTKKEAQSVLKPVDKIKND
jgi:hypothetical protein